MAFPKHFLDELRGRINVVELVGRTVQLKKRGRDHWGCCPFHGEKTPSFKVSEDRDDYHCFGCGAHGSAFDFVMNTEGLSFPEAVERLADMAGMQVPEETPEDRQRADRMTRLAEACEAAAKWFSAQLHSQTGEEARAYLDRRGVGDQAIAAFRLGYAPDRNDGLKSALIERGFTDEELVEAGLIARPDDGRSSYDRFRHRLMFPIADRRGRVIAFGGRALGDARAKYLNSPETPLFSKSRTLYNQAMARGAARDAGTVIVAEGYMDVIALAEAGFRHAVAPLGTAVTEEQIGLLWQMTAEPIMCLDGDAAGLRAAQRAAERALPILKPGKSLRFALLPEGMDPDDLLRSHGNSTMERVLSESHSIHETLFDKEVEGVDFGSPDSRADLMHRLYAHADTAKDKEISKHYRMSFRDIFFKKLNAFRRQSQQGGYRDSSDTSSRLGENIPPIDASDHSFHKDIAIAIYREKSIAVRYRSLLDEFDELISDTQYAGAVRCMQAWADSNENTIDIGDQNSFRRALHESGFGDVLFEIEKSLSDFASSKSRSFRWIGRAETLAGNAFQCLYRKKMDEEKLDLAHRIYRNAPPNSDGSDFQNILRLFSAEAAKKEMEIFEKFSDFLNDEERQIYGLG